MTNALDRVFGHLLLVVATEALFVVLVLQNPGAWYDKHWGAFVAFGLGGLGIPWTLPVPYLITQDGALAPVLILLLAPLVNLFLRFIGFYVGADKAPPIAPE
jgi:hypothetical protein